MYWPIGAPKVYALTKHALPANKTQQSRDGLEDGPESSGSLSSSSAVERAFNAQDEGISQLREEANEHSLNNGAYAVAGEGEILALQLSRNGSIFATITRSALTVWQTKPPVALASVIRSVQSMKAYGPNSALLLRPDALIIVVETRKGYLITYNLSADPNARVYHTELPASGRHLRKGSVDGYSNYRRPSSAATAEAGPGEGDGIREVNIRFRMVIRIDAGISKALALDDELVVATRRPAALQCIRWVSDNKQAQTKTELLSKMLWVEEKCHIVEMVHDRPMNLTCWITDDGRAYAVQRRSPSDVDMDNPASLFQGFCFRDIKTGEPKAVNLAICARFSLISVGYEDGSIDVFVVKDYMGNIPLSHQVRLSVSSSTTGKLTFLSYSPDGYCMLAGYEKGWALWSVYGKAGANSFSTDLMLSKVNDEQWLQGARDAFWIGGGCELALLGMHDYRLWILDVARNALAGCYDPANASRGLLHSSRSVTIYKGHDIPDLTALPSDNMALWQNIQMPSSYLLHQWPIKCAVVSPDGKYIAVAGRRGLAHYSTTSMRWKTFEDPVAENEFSVRGGMSWYKHFLIACVEAQGRGHEVRVFSREKSLDYSSVLWNEQLSAPAIFTSVTGTDSVLVYTYDNVLLHFIIVVNPAGSGVKLFQVGQIGFHGIIRAPPRVRSISWILPEDQMEHGDPSQDVAAASVLFLVDGKLVLLQPTVNEYGELKYDMRVIAQNVEFYVLTRDQQDAYDPLSTNTNVTRSDSNSNGLPLGERLGHSLRDSLWYFDGKDLHVWPDIHDLLTHAPADLGRDLPPTVRVPVDFHPVSVLVPKAIISGLDADLVQRKDINFSFFRHAARTQLFLPQLLRWHLSEYDEPAARYLAGWYKHLPYFPHALEVLLHDILDTEVDHPPDPPETALLPTALAFLSSSPAYLDIIVNCTRKTELRSWRTLFASLPPVLQLFERSLAQNRLKTAAGYLLVLHTFEQESFQIHGFARLLRRAVEAQDWELCRELARFLVGIDGTGATLIDTLSEAGLGGEGDALGSLDERLMNGAEIRRPQANGNSGSSSLDYFSLEPRQSEAQEGREEFTTPNS